MNSKMKWKEILELFFFIVLFLFYLFGLKLHPKLLVMPEIQYHEKPATLEGEPSRPTQAEKTHTYVSKYLWHHSMSLPSQL